MGRQGEMPAMVKGQAGKGSMRPQAEMRDTPTRNRNRPVAARATPTPSNLSFSSDCSISGSLKDSRNTSTK